MTFQLNMLVLLAGAVQGALLSLWFFRNKEKTRSHIVFSFLLGAIGLQLLLKVLSKAWLTQNAFPWYVISNQLPYVIAPLLFLCFRAAKGKPLKAVDALHFVPFVVATLFVFVFVYWLFLMPMTPWPRAALQSGQLGVYCLLVFRGNDIAWRRFALATGVVEFIIILAMATMQEFYPSFPDLRWLFVLLSALIYWMSYQVISRAGIFSSAPGPAQMVAKYSHSSLKPEDITRIEDRLIAAMKKHQPYLDASVGLDELARRINVPRHHLSQVINDRFGKTFIEFMNDFRVEEAGKRLLDPKYSRFTIASIALDCGFNSLSAFNEAFRKRHLVTPSAYKKGQKGV